MKEKLIPLNTLEDVGVVDATPAKLRDCFLLERQTQSTENEIKEMWRIKTYTRTVDGLNLDVVYLDEIYQSYDKASNAVEELAAPCLKSKNNRIQNGNK